MQKVRVHKFFAKYARSIVNTCANLIFENSLSEVKFRSVDHVVLERVIKFQFVKQPVVLRAN